MPGTGTTAFAGPTGAGGSTVFSLVERFHETTGGRMPTGGDVRQWPSAEPRSAVGHVERDAPATVTHAGKNNRGDAGPERVPGGPG
ncbi:hypothetical protein ACIGW0_10075 [Streptomyces bikiniensis]|uniref:Uncharacterized protein n=1 Tax=Streptomyces bikiniensis TaxID=1896 RepID=A0ABW8CQ82_STRBI